MYFFLIFESETSALKRLAKDEGIKESPLFQIAEEKFDNF